MTLKASCALLSFLVLVELSCHIQATKVNSQARDPTETLRSRRCFAGFCAISSTLQTLEKTCGAEGKMLSEALFITARNIVAAKKVRF